MPFGAERGYISQILGVGYILPLIEPPDKRTSKFLSSTYSYSAPDRVFIGVLASVGQYNVLSFQNRIEPWIGRVSVDCIVKSGGSGVSGPVTKLG